LIQAETLELLEWPRLCQHLATFAATKLGVVAARQLSIPSTPAETLHLLAQTQEVYQLENRLLTGLSFEGIQDIGESLERAAIGGILAGEELLAIATTLNGVRRLRRTIDEQEDVPVLKALVAEVRTYPELEQEIHRCINERGDVTDRASVKLAAVRQQLRQVRDRIYQTLHSILQRQGNAIQEQLITQRGDRFVIPVKAPQKDAIPGIVHDSSSSGATLYIEPQAIVSQGNQLRQLQRKEQVEAEVIRQGLTAQVAAVKLDLDLLLAIATTLDLATAKARYSNWLGANPPHLINTNSQTQNLPITLRQLRHPLLIWQEQHEQGAAVVPVDLKIHPLIRVVTITGPNTGGKTVTLKTLGLAALMAKAGLFVAAREPVELPWFDQVLADIGDEQSLQQSLSTFSGHIRRISRIINAIENPPSEMENSALVLLDEVGAGTDPAEGSALAIALLQYLANQALLTIATTHYGELKALKYQDERFENASVEFDDSTLSPTYRLLWGIPGRSNALTIASRLGLKTDIVTAAQGMVGGDSQEMNEVIAGLESQRRSQESKAKEADKLLQQAERLHQELSRKTAILQERERDLKLSQELAVQQAIAQAKAEIAAVIRRLQQGTATAQDAREATAAVQEIAEKQLSQTKPKSKGFIPQIGDRIRIPRLGQTAEVLTNPDESGMFSIRFGMMKMTVGLADIESLDGQKPEVKVTKTVPKTPDTNSPPPATKTANAAIRTSQNTVDIRGSRVADAEVDLEQAIAKATAAGTLWIIHGKGTGRLRQGVHEFLQQHPQVERFQLAESSDGGAGVTVVYLH